MHVHSGPFARALLTAVLVAPWIPLSAQVDKQGDTAAVRAAAPRPLIAPGKSSVARLYADDVDALNDLVYQGHKLFLTDVVRRQSLGCVQYCSVAVRNAVHII